MRSTHLLAAILLQAKCQCGSSTTSTRDELYVFHYEMCLAYHWN